MKKCKYILLLFLAFVLSGCTTYHSSNKINNNRSMDFSLVYGEDNDREKPKTYRNSLLSDMENHTFGIGYDLSEINDDDENSYTKMTGKIDLIDEFCCADEDCSFNISDFMDNDVFSLNSGNFYRKNSQNSGLFYCERQGNKTVFTAKLKYRYKAIRCIGDEHNWVYPDALSDDDNRDDYYNTAEASYSVDLSDVYLLDSNADSNEDGVLKWNLDPTVISDINFTFELPTSDVHFDEEHINAPFVMTPGEVVKFFVYDDYDFIIYDMFGTKVEYTVDDNGYYYVAMPEKGDLYIEASSDLNDEIIDYNNKKIKLITDYYKSGEKIYFKVEGTNNIDDISIIDVNGNNIKCFYDDENKMFYFVMPDSDVSISLKQLKKEIDTNPNTYNVLYIYLFGLLVVFCLLIAYKKYKYFKV